MGGAACYGPSLDCNGNCDAPMEIGPPPCGSAALYGDDFEDNEVGEPWIMEWDGASITEEGGAVTMRLAGTPDGDTVQAALVSYRTTRLRGVRLSVEVLEVPPADGLGRFAMIVEDDAGEALELAVTAGQLLASRRDHAPYASLEYDPDAHRFWAVTELDGVVFFEVSADALTWQTVARDGAPPLDLDAVTARLEAGAHAGTSDAGTVRIDNVNGGQPSGTWCSVTGLSDSFDAPELGPLWVAQADGECEVAPAGGQLRVGGGGLSTCSVRSRSLYDFRGGQVVVDVAQAAVDSASTRLRLQVGPGWFVEMAAEFGRLVARKSEGATIAMETPPAFDPQADRFWRLSEAGGRVEWATSPDGQAWKVLYTDSWMLPLDRFEVILGIVVEEGAPPAEARFDNLNPRPAARPE